MLLPFLPYFLEIFVLYGQAVVDQESQLRILAYDVPGIGPYHKGESFTGIVDGQGLFEVRFQDLVYMVHVEGKVEVPLAPEVMVEARPGYARSGADVGCRGSGIAPLFQEELQCGTEDFFLLFYKEGTLPIYLL